VLDDLTKIMAATEAWDAGSAYMNFVEKPEGASRFYPKSVYDRLRAIKAHYDPEDLFRANHPIPPAG
jgi:uncharacterized membrane-anchored protein